MARPIKNGLDYFSLDINFFEDDKIQLLESEFGIQCSALAIKLLCKIYKSGYYYAWTEKEKLLLIKNNSNSFDMEYLESFISKAAHWNFFNQVLLEKYNILTSSGIQKRYFSIIKENRRKKITVKKEYLLISINDYINKDNANIKVINVCINEVNADDNGVNEGKEEEPEIINADINEVNEDDNGVNERFNATNKTKQNKSKVKNNTNISISKITDRDDLLIEENLLLFFNCVIFRLREKEKLKKEKLSELTKKYDIAYIRDAIEYMQRRKETKTILNPVGLLVRCLENPSWRDR